MLTAECTAALGLWAPERGYAKLIYLGRDLCVILILWGTAFQLLAIKDWYR